MSIFAPPCADGKLSIGCGSGFGTGGKLVAFFGKDMLALFYATGVKETPDTYTNTRLRRAEVRWVFSVNAGVSKRRGYSSCESPPPVGPVV